MNGSSSTPTLDPRFIAGIEMIRRTGATRTQVRWSEDEKPIVWFAVAFYDGDRWETAAGRGPDEAVLRLCERVIDGGTCTHCSKPTMFIPDLDWSPTPLAEFACIYEWDPEVQTFRRGCEGADR